MSDKTTKTGTPIATRQLLHTSRPIFEQGTPGRSGASLPPLDVPAVDAAKTFGALARTDGGPGLAGVMMIRAYHEDKGRRPSKVLIPDSAHGTNPASCALNAMQTVGLKTGADGLLHVDSVKEACAAHKDDIAAIMITNPSTLGL